MSTHSCTRCGQARVSSSAGCGCQGSSTGSSGSSSSGSAPCPDAFPGGLTRTRFFEGMVLTQADLDDEQRYWRSKRQLGNRALGQGVVWGLRAELDRRVGVVRLQPGYALDCCGRDLVVSEAQQVSARQLANPRSALVQQLALQAIEAKKAAEKDKDKTAAPPRGGLAHLVLHAVEVAEEPRVVSAGACTGARDRTEPSRVRETTRLCLEAIEEDSAPSPTAQLFDDLEAYVQGLPKQAQALLKPELEAFRAEEDDAPPLSLLLRADGQEHRVDMVLRDRTWVWPSAQSLPFTLPPGTRLHVELRASGGWWLREGCVEGALQMSAPASSLTLDGTPRSTTEGDDTRSYGAASSLGEVARVAPPFALALAWAVVLPPPPVDTRLRFQAPSVELARPLVADVTGQLHDLSILLDVRQAPGQSVPTLRLQVQGAWRWRAQEERSPACLPQLSSAFFTDGDAQKNLSSAMLGGLYAWLTAHGAGEEPWTGHRLLAHWALLVAWRMLGFDPALSSDKGESNKRLAHLLRELLQRWCEGLHYAGPRCRSAHRGVVLGTVEVNERGELVSLDPWEGRRQVLTGPLVEHWMGQVGLAAPDVVVGRFASAICCLAGLPTQTSPGLPSIPYTQLGAVEPSTPWELRELHRLAGAMVISGGAALLMAEEDSLLAHLDQRGLRVKVIRRDVVTSASFLQAIAAEVASPTPIGAERAWVRLLVEGQSGRRLHMLRPASEEELRRFGPARTELTKLIAEDMGRRRLGALARAPATDLMASLLARANITAPSENPDAAAINHTLMATNRTSIGDVVNEQPEHLIGVLEKHVGRRVSPEAFNAVHAANLERTITLGDAVEEGIKEWSETGEGRRAFTREALREPAFHEALERRIRARFPEGIGIDRSGAEAAALEAWGFIPDGQR